MKDTYPPSSIPAEWLVPADRQPDYSEEGHPAVDGHANVGRHLTDRQVAAGRGAATAAIQAETGRRYSFSELSERSSRLAAWLLEAGLGLGDRVAYRSANDAEVLVVLAAIWKAGGVVVPVPALARPEEVRHYLEDSAARFLFVHARAPLEDDHPASVERVIGFGGEAILPEPGAASPALPRVPADLPAILWHTGGTTGRPKGCYHTHRRFLLGGYRFGEGTGTGPGQVLAAAAPVGHALGFIHHTIFALLHGATAVFMERFSDPAVILDAVGRYRITTLTCLTASWAKMAEVITTGPERDTSSLLRCYAMWQSASASDVFDFWQGRGVQLFNNFGSTSFATWVLVPRPGHPSPRASLGEPLPGYTVRAMDAGMGAVVPGEVGRMAVKGPTGLTYWRLPELQRRDVLDGWTMSDDLIGFDADGQCHYYGRTDYMISTGGYKVAPGEVEAVLARHPAVREVAVVPAPCPIRQEMVAAFIAVHEGAAGDDRLRKDLQDLVRAALASYKVPRRIDFVSALPRDPVGKVQTRLVKQMADRPAAAHAP